MNNPFAWNNIFLWFWWIAAISVMLGCSSKIVPSPKFNAHDDPVCEAYESDSGNLILIWMYL